MKSQTPDEVIPERKVNYRENGSCVVFLPMAWAKSNKNPQSVRIEVYGEKIIITPKKEG